METEIDAVAEQLLHEARYTPCIDNWCKLIEHYYFHKDKMGQQNSQNIFETVEWYREHYSTPQDPIKKEEIFLPIYD